MKTIRPFWIIHCVNKDDIVNSKLVQECGVRSALEFSSFVVQIVLPTPRISIPVRVSPLTKIYLVWGFETPILPDDHCYFVLISFSPSNERNWERHQRGSHRIRGEMKFIGHWFCDHSFYSLICCEQNPHNWIDCYLSLNVDEMCETVSFQWKEWISRASLNPIFCWHCDSHLPISDK
jgi:hypothetical protein